MKRAVLYSRVSLAAQADFGVSLEMQEAMARAHCEREGWEFCGLYTDTMSGRKDARPELLKMEKAAVERMFDVLLVYKMDRLARSLLRLLQIAADFSDRGIGLVSLTEPIDFTTPMGKALLAMLGAFAEMEAQNVSTRVRDALSQVARRGGYTGAAHVVLGYRWSDEEKKHVIVPEEAALVRQMFDMYLSLRSLRAVTNALNEAGHLTTTGCQFGVSSVQKAIKNPIYVGERVWGKVENQRNSKGVSRQVQQAREKWIVTEDAHEPIIDRETFDAAQAIMAENAFTTPRTVYGRRRWAWSGLFTCTGCGGPMNRTQGGGNQRKHEGVGCARSRTRGHAACTTRAYLSDRFLAEVLLPAIVRAVEEGQAAKPATKRSRKKPTGPSPSEIAALMAKKERALELYVEGRWSKEKLAATEAEVDAKLLALKEGTAPEPKALPPIGSFLDAWERTSEAGRGAMLRLYVEGGEVDGETVTVHFREEAGLSPLVVQKVSYRGAYGRGRPKQAASGS